MKKLNLTKSKSAMVDSKMHTVLSNWKWSLHSMGYACRNRKGKLILLHRQIMDFPKLNVDHINGDKLDNRTINLRLCTQAENTRNSKSHKDSTSKYKGVFWNKDTRKWRTRLMFNSKTVLDKCFVSETDAADEYNAQSKIYHGKFAKFNNLTENIASPI